MMQYPSCGLLVHHVPRLFIRNV